MLLFPIPATLYLSFTGGRSSLYADMSTDLLVTLKRVTKRENVTIHIVFSAIDTCDQTNRASAVWCGQQT